MTEPSVPQSDSHRRPAPDPILGRRTVILSLVLAGGAVAWAGDPGFYRRRAHVRCGIPGWPGYGVQEFQKPVLGETDAVLWLELTDARQGSSLAAPAPERRVRIYQGAKDLVVDHCTVSRLALAIDETGQWTASLTAEQNPFIMVGTERQATPAARFLRNEFHLQLRGVALAKAADPDRIAVIGQPEMFCITLQPFWLTRESRERISQVGRLTPRQLQQLPLVDRVEVELRIK